MSENVSKTKSQRQKFILIFLGGALGILLLLFGGGLASERESDAQPSSAGEQSTAEEYAAMLEARVESICSGVRGAGKVRVLVSLKGGYRTVYAFDSQNGSSGYKSELVLSGSGSERQAVVSAYENPEIAGVGIVCEGADSPEVRAEIISLVCASLGVSTNKVFVAKM